MDKVLIVDNDLEFLNSLKVGLEKYSQFEILTAANGLEALDILKKTRISVLVTDLEMPEMDGRELLDYMKKNRPQIPCVVMTAKESPESNNNADRDILQYIEKPFDFNQLFTVIMEGLDRLDEGIFWKTHRK